jgi:glyoxylase-like metal-dependent hydrolase (beta-lactamase superfamily II)
LHYIINKLKNTMKIIPFICGPIDDNVYIVESDAKECVIVDAPFDCCDELCAFLAQAELTPKYIFITHTHWDHIGGLAELKRRTQAEICVHRADAFRLSESIMTLGGGRVNIETVEPDTLLEGGEVLKCGELNFEVLHTPGPSPGAVCYYERGNDAIFVGDVLFRLSIGRTDFEGSNHQDMMDSIKNKLLVLSDDVKVFPGHNELTTIGYERRNNMFLRGL